MITGKNHIGFERSAKGDKTFKTFNPELNTETDWTFYEASKDELEEAVSKAWTAFSNYQDICGKQKAQFLRGIANEINALGTTLIETYCKESGLPKRRAEGERKRTCFQLNTFADLIEEGSWVNAWIDEGNPDREPQAKPDLRKMLVPIGPIAVFGASNFPLAYSTAGGDTASALAAGCPVVVKSHPMHAGTGELVASAISKAAKETGMPDGVFSNLNSSGIEIGQQLVKHPMIKGVGFTGSIKGGRALFDAAAQRDEPIPVFAEMGSINPVVLLPKALRNNASHWATTYANSITLGTGQFCTNPGLILGVNDDGLKEFTEQLSKAIVEVKPSCMLHPNILERYNKNKSSIVQQESTEVTAAYRNDVAENYAKQAIVTVDGASFLENPALHQEVFGPFSMVVQCENISELEQIIKKLEGQLTGTIIADDDEIDDHNSLISALRGRVGRLIYNGVPTGVEVCPSMQHGGPYPASTDNRFGAVGIDAIRRWVRPVSYQDWPDRLLPPELKNKNPLGISRLVNGKTSTKALE